MKLKRKVNIRQLAFIVSVCLCLLWSFLATGASLAWFSDSSTELNNIFHFAEFDLQLFHLTEDGYWEEVEQDTKIFDDEALYEPGYVQTIYLKVRNNGTVPFDWNTAVRADYIQEGINVYGDRFDLREYLRFGVVADSNFDALKTKVRTRAQAVAAANESLDYYSSTKVAISGAQEADGEMYLAVIVRMPEDVTNVANYKHPHKPEIHLSVIVSATQQNS